VLSDSGHKCYFFAQQTPYDWDFPLEPHNSVDSAVFPSLITRPRLSAGRVLGGSGAINAMIYSRGHSTDYDAWDLALGVSSGGDNCSSSSGGSSSKSGSRRSGWSHADLLPLFKRGERVVGFNIDQRWNISLIIFKINVSKLYNYTTCYNKSYISI